MSMACERVTIFTLESFYKVHGVKLLQDKLLFPLCLRLSYTIKYTVPSLVCRMQARTGVDLALPNFDWIQLSDVDFEAVV